MNPETLDVRNLLSGNPATAVADYFPVHQGQVLIAQPVANDTDIEYDSLTPTITTQASSGYAYFDSNNDLHYQANAGYVGPDVVSYRVNDGTNDSNIVDITINVNNIKPVAGPDAYNVHQGQSITVNPMANDVDGDGDNFTPSLITQATNGYAYFDSANLLVYTPNAGYVGTDTITYHTYDGGEYSVPATISISVNNIKPVAGPDAYNVHQGQSITVNPMSNDVDGDLDNFTPSVVTQATNGYAYFDSANLLVYTPNAGYVGPDTFIYHTYDGGEYSAPATISISVNNIRPVAGPDAYNVHQGQSITVNPMSNDVDGDGDTFTPSLITQATNGYAYFDANNLLVYTPNAGYVGPDTFIYHTYDGGEYSAPATISISVNNIKPVAVADSGYTVAHGQALDVQPMSNDSDADFDTFTPSIFDPPATGYAYFDSAGHLYYAPSATFLGVDTLTYRIWDGAEYSDPVTISITVTPSAAELLYADYLAAVAIADSDYLTAVAIRDGAIDSARADAQADADDLYDVYESAVFDAQTLYDSAILDIEATYHSAWTDADADWADATADAQADYYAAVDDAQATLDIAMVNLDGDYEDAIDAADAAFDDSVLPYQIARDAAFSAWQADPENSGLEQYYNDAHTALNDAIFSATDQRDNDYDAAYSSWQSGADDALVDFEDVQIPAWAAYEIAIADPNTVWDDAVAGTRATYLAAKQGADSDLIAAEADAWGIYTDGVLLIETNLAILESSIKNNYASVVSSAYSAWTVAEANAWNIYEDAMAELPAVPKLGDRITGPPIVDFDGVQLGVRVDPALAVLQPDITIANVSMTVDFAPTPPIAAYLRNQNPPLRIRIEIDARTMNTPISLRLDGATGTVVRYSLTANGQIYTQTGDGDNVRPLSSSATSSQIVVFVPIDDLTAGLHYFTAGYRLPSGAIDLRPTSRTRPRPSFTQRRFNVR